MTKQAGRPAIKKGKSSWKPASLNEFTGKDPNYVYRMSRKDPTNLSKKAQEGWETVSDMNSLEIEHQSPDRIHDGKQLTSVLEGHDWVLQKLPKELADARNDYMNDVTARRTKGLTAHVKNDMRKEGGNAPVHGDITISSRKGVEVID